MGVDSQSAVQTCSDLLDEEKYQAELAETRKTPVPPSAKVIPFRRKPYLSEDLGLAGSPNAGARWERRPLLLGTIGHVGGN